MTTGSYSFAPDGQAGGVLTLPGPAPVVVGAIASANGLVLYQEVVDWACDGVTGVVTAVAGGGIGASDTVLIAWASADTVIVTD